MIVVTVMYPAKPDAKFDLDYYLNKHMPLVQDSWGKAGLQSYNILHGQPGPDGSPPAFHLIANLNFATAEAFQGALAQSGAKVMGDVPNFTDLTPAVQISNTVGAWGSA